MIGFEGQIRISRGPERCNNCHISQPPVDTKLPWPPPAPFIIQLDYTITAYLQHEEKVFKLKHTTPTIVGHCWQRASFTCVEIYFLMEKKSVISTATFSSY